MKKDINQIITNQFIEAIETAKENGGKLPWEKGWNIGGQRPLRSNGKPYRGINSLVLSLQAKTHPVWLTFNQAKADGGMVRKGEKGTAVSFFKFIDAKQKDGTKKRVPLLRYYTVFNIDQIDFADGLPAKYEKHSYNPTEFDATDDANYEKAEEMLRGMLAMEGAPICEIGSEAFYVPSTHSITLPPMDSFLTRACYYSVAFHEFAHSTHKALGRELGSRFGSDKYAKEELVAELAASFLCSEAGIFDHTRENSSGYLDGWLNKFKGDPKLLVQAGGLAQKVFDYLTGNQWEG